MLPTLLRPLILIVFTVIFVLLSLFVYSKYAPPIPFSVTSVTTQKTDSFFVSGEGRAKIKPDPATVRVGVQAESRTAEDAQNKMNQSINKVIAAIKALGVEEKNIKTENYNVNPVVEDIGPVQNFAGPSDKLGASSYTANTNISIITSDTELANKIIDTATQNGATQVGGVQFDTKDNTLAENEARSKAIEEAKKKAQIASQAAGFSLGKIINYQESSGGNSPIMYAMDAKSSVREAAPTQVQPGENEVVVNVTLYYEVR